MPQKRPLTAFGRVTPRGGGIRVAFHVFSKSRLPRGISSTACFFLTSPPGGRLVGHLNASVHHRRLNARRSRMRDTGMSALPSALERTRYARFEFFAC